MSSDRRSTRPILPRFKIPPPPRLPPAAVVLLTLLLPPAGLAVEEVLRPWIETVPFVLFFLVVAVTSSIGGRVAGVVSALLCAVCGWWFISKSPIEARAAGALVGAAVFLPVGVVVAGFGAMVGEGFREREIATALLAEAVRSRDEFISAASHELKTPLTALSLVVQQLARIEGQSIAAPDPALERLHASVRRQTSRLTTLVNNLLDVSRITSGRMHLELEEVDLAEVAREVAERFDGELAQAGSVLSLEAEAGVVGRWDRMRLDQVLTNLLSNAVKYGLGRPVRISVARAGSSAVISVADMGIGIAPEDRVRIFDRFERGPHGNAPGGFGVGLWIVREVVTALGGGVTVESAPGRGTTFTVTLPIGGPGAAPPVA
ncbi:MAG TPA: HAMP domain-containing sensor histidine kinase [Anaeromyxobacteraceae bacterium]|nr:HAMP domain-containing sensor histidine kinase [Anaeromyxobacteraceae bacterium]